MKSHREPSKCRQWEKVRRDKLSKSFTVLSKLLPNHDPSLTLSKIDILRKATTYIEELQQKLKDVLTADGVKSTERDEIKALSEHIRKLLTRNGQLSDLLKDAGIKIPTEYGPIKQFKEPLRWSNKITPEQAKELAEKEAQKENEKKSDVILKPKSKVKTGLKKVAVVGGKLKKEGKISRKLKSKKSAIINVQLSNVIATQKNFIKASAQPCFIITNNPPLTQNCRTSKSASTVVTNSSSLAAPKMASIISPPTSTIVGKANSTLGSLGPGTLILANGNIVPILPQPTLLPTPTILTNSTPILLKPHTNNTTLIVMPAKPKETPPVSSASNPKSSTVTTITCSSTTLPIKSYTRIRPKLGMTKTTQANKVPIPALTSFYGSSLSSVKPNELKQRGKCDKISTKKITKIYNKKPVKRKLESEPSVTDKRPKVVVGGGLVSAGITKEGVSDKAPAEESVPKISVGDDNKQSTIEKPARVVQSEAKTEVCLEVAGKAEASSGGGEKVVQPPQKTVDSKKEIAENANLSTKAAGPQSDSPNVVRNDSARVSIVNELPKDCAELVSCPNVSASKLVLPNALKTSEEGAQAGSSMTNEHQSVVKEKPTMESTVTNTMIGNCHKSTDNQPEITASSNKNKKLMAGTSVDAKLAISTTPSNDGEIQDKNLELGMNLNHSELSNDIFSSLQVPIGGQNPESTSPTAAFLLAFPLVSSLTGVKVTEVIEEENSDSRHGTPTLLQIGTMDTTKTTQSMQNESLTPNLLNLDNFSFFSGKDMCSNFYSSFDNPTNVYPAGSAPCGANNQNLDGPKGAATELKEALGASKQTKIVCESSAQPKLHKVLSDPPLVPHTSNSSILCASDAQVTKVQNFVQQTQTTIAYSKLVAASVTSAYVHETHVHYDGRQKPPTRTPSCKDMNLATYSTSSSRKNNPDLTQYNAATSNAVSVAQCHAFNPFSDFSKSNTTVHSYSTFSKPYGDPLYTNSTHYNYPQHNANNFEQSAYYPPKSTSKTGAYPAPNYAETSYNVDCKTKRDSTTTNHRHNSINYYNQTKAQTKQAKPVKPNNQPKPPINWMTSDFRSQPSNTTEYLLPPFTKEIEYNANSFYPSNSFVPPTTHTAYFNANANPPEFHHQDNRKFDAIPMIPPANSTAAQRGEFEENQFSWSPTKLPQFLETPHSFVSSTLPTLVGDLALGTTQPAFVDQQKVDQAKKDRRSKVQAVNYDNQSNFLSVSQLVENKTDLGGSTRAGGNRRSNANARGTKSNNQKTNKHSHKTTEHKDLEGGFNAKLDPTVVMEKTIKQNAPPNVNYGMQGVENSNWAAECNKSSRHVHKNPQSSYSAEALIGHQDQSDSSVPKQRYRQQQTNYSVNKTIPIPSFLSDNIVPYFPPVELPQDNNFMQPNPNYQGGSLSHTFPTSVQNNAYPSGTYISTGATITSSYLPIPEFASTHEYGPPIPDNSIPHPPVDKVDNTRNTRIEPIKQPPRPEDRPHLPQQINADCSANSATNFMKKSKHKHSNEANIPGIVDFGFLSMPSTINSPILPDDFHAHSNFLPPPTPSQLYPCKNPLYSKQSSDLLPLPPVTRSTPQHFEGSSGPGNAGSSLTSFNLSAIFPEINKGAVPLPGLYSESSRNKNYNFQRNYLGGSVQVSFSNKSTSSSSYVNSIATTYAPTN